MPQKPVKSTLFVTRIIAGPGVTVTPNGGTGIVTISVGGTEAPTAIVGGATPFPITGQAAASATAAGGEVDIAGAPGGATSGAGGAVTLKGGNGTAGTSNGGAVTIAGGSAFGAATGGAATLTGGAGATPGTATVTGGAATGTNGTGAIASLVGGAGVGTGPGGAAEIQGGAGGTSAGGSGGNSVIAGGNAGAGSNANGGDVNIVGGVLDGTGVNGVVRISGINLVAQGAEATQNTAATLTAAQILAKILTSNPAGAVNLQLPLATAMDTALPSSVAGDAFDFSVISIAGSTNLPTITTNTGWTLVGGMTFTAVAGNAGRFRARKTGAGAWTLYRIAG